MINIEIKDIVTLDDNKEYMVISKAEYEENLYFYLVEIHDNDNMKFCQLKLINEVPALVEVEDTDLIAKIAGPLHNNVQDGING